MTEIDMTAALIKLADEGITAIQIYYEGSGDSGCIDAVNFITDKVNSIEEAEERFNDWKNIDVFEYNDERIAAIKDFAEEKILSDIEDWWNNEGGYGDLYILVPSGEYSVNNRIRITEIQDYTHEGNMIEKTVE